MKKSKIKYYNNQAHSPSKAFIESIKKLKELGKDFNEEIIRKEIKESNLYKDNQINDIDIEQIINYFKERNEL